MTSTDILAGVKTETVARAWELIEDGGIVPLRGRVYRTVSSDGREMYLTSPGTCNCPAGLKGRVCYHSAAVAIDLDLTPVALRA